MRALSIRQPYAELILRGIKTAELRSRSTSIVGERFYIYAAKTKAKRPIWSEDLRVAPPGSPPAWLIELAEQVKMIEPELLRGALLPTGVIVGSAVIERVSQADAVYRWHLCDVERAKKLRKPRGHPQPVWFKPF